MTTFEDGYNIADLKYNVSPVVKIVGKAKDDKDCPIPDSRFPIIYCKFTPFHLQCKNP
jgi:hypothetical protein